MVAALIGLEVGDEIIKINNTSLDKEDPHDVGAYLKQKTFQLTIRQQTPDGLRKLISALESTKVFKQLNFDCNYSVVNFRDQTMW